MLSLFLFLFFLFFLFFLLSLSSLLLLLLLPLLLLLYCYYFSIINVIHFILFHFIFHCSYYYDFCQRFCVTCASPVMIHIIYSHCSYISSMSHMSSSLSFSFFFNTTSHWGKIQPMNSSGMVYTYPLITLGKPYGKYYYYYYFFIFLFRFVSYSLVTTVDVLTSSFIFTT